MSREILCIGATNLDRKLRLLGTLHPASSNPAQQTESLGGVARNVAENLLRMKLPVRLRTAVGEDDAGRRVLAQIPSAGSLRVRDAATDSYTAVLDGQGELVMGLAAMPLVESLLPAAMPTRLAPLTLIDLNLPAQTVAHLIALAREQEGVRLLAVAVSEPKMTRLPQDLRGLHGLLLNRGELQQLHAGESAEALLALHARGVQCLALTLGAQGVLCSEAGTTPVALSAPAVEVIEVTGAGDAFAAGVCAALWQDHDWLAACRQGIELAARALQTLDSVPQ
ncbi:MAG TPA: carbohydrate kinase family protein [Burkholderiaceae bacterium]|jgi:pseudouridine kinase